LGRSAVREGSGAAIVCRRHASHITVVLSKAAHSGPSVCLRARAPCPLRVSCPGTDRAERAVQAAGVSVQPSCRRERAVQTAGSCASVPPLVKTGSEPDVQLTHGPGRTVALPYFVPRQCALLCGPYRHICVCAQSTAVFHGVYDRSPLLTTSLFCH
jgi:hypothetical protein